MFSAFSFGKIIKTILPGSILTAALLLIAEAFWALDYPGQGFLMAQIPKDWITPFGAALIPASLILGFFLNTMVWMNVNYRVRARCTKEVAALAVYAPLREKLTAVLAQDLQNQFATPAPPFMVAGFTSPPSLEYYYLPAVGLVNLNYLWESYFCWYEFDINSAAALVPFVLSAAFLLWVKLHMVPTLCAGLILLMLAVALVLAKMLWRAAIKNLVSYEKNLVLLISGALVKGTSDAEAAAAP